MQGGLFIFASVDGVPNLNIIPSQDEFSICLGETVTFNLTIGNGFTSNVTLSVGAGSLPADVQFSQNPAQPGSTVQVTVSNIASTQGVANDLVIVANDGVEGNSTDVAIAVAEAPVAPGQTLPAENATAVPVNANFEWQAVAGATSYKLQVADDLAAFDANIVYSANTAATSFTLSNNLTTGKTYYWRVSSKNECGQTPSAIRTFTTDGVNAVGSLEGVSLTVFPNPAKEYVMVSSTAPMPRSASLSLVATTGQVLFQREFPIGATNIALPVGDYPAGVYFLKMASEKEVLVQKIVVE
ncbi:MAG: T9SS type A sorting domain-containing protein [Saprospiraceae bacterium]|nr:T9SS type A sorting domain-containing protein [Saprospiraceae bacterium]